MMKNKKRGIVLAGNWKMNHAQKETHLFFDQLKDVKKIHSSLQLFLIPSFLSLSTAQNRAKDLSIPLTVAAQNAHGELKGAYTGEVSGSMLKEIGIQTVLIGHSERRNVFHETDAFIGQKVNQLIQQGFKIILCIGETETERKNKETFQILEGQLKMALQTFESLPKDCLIIAYEPVWAIGTGENATPEEANEVHSFIRSYLGKKFTNDDSEKLSILYGGSVTPSNFSSLLSMSEVDGALVGGASLKPDSFVALINAAELNLRQS